MAEHKVQQPLARQQSERWPGIVGRTEESSNRLRRIANEVCQVMNRRAFGEGVAGTHQECMLGMTAAILAKMMELTKAPRGGLAAILDIHTTRVAAVLDDRRWPSQCRPVARYLLSAILWMFLGPDWEDLNKKFAVPDRNHWKFGDIKMIPNFDRSHAEYPIFDAVRIAENIVDYFFRLPGDAPQPYFAPDRRNWNAPYDRGELALGLQWMRRQVQVCDCNAYAAFFVSTFEAANSLFDLNGLAKSAGLMTIGCKNRIRIHLFRPMGPRGDAIEFLEGNAESNLIQSFKVIQDRINSLGKMEERTRREQRGPENENSYNNQKVRDVMIYHDDDGAGKSAARVLRSMLCFMFVGYTRAFSEGSEVLEHVYVLRPISEDDSMPFVFELTPRERQLFLDAACERYREFRNSLSWFRSNMPGKDDRVKDQEAEQQAEARDSVYSMPVAR